MGAGSLGSAADLPTECASAESFRRSSGLFVCTHCALHEGIEVGTRPAHICFTDNGFASETQSIRLTTSQSACSTTQAGDVQLGNTTVNWKQRTLRFLAPRSGD